MIMHRIALDFPIIILNNHGALKIRICLLIATLIASTLSLSCYITYTIIYGALFAYRVLCLFISNKLNLDQCSYDVHFTGSTSIGMYGISTNLACPVRDGNRLINCKKKLRVMLASNVDDFFIYLINMLTDFSRVLHTSGSQVSTPIFRDGLTI